jgi:small subunit ribosomal protein S15
MIATDKKLKLISKNRLHEKDTGSSQVQVALLNERIEDLTKHLKKNKKDESSRRGLLKLVSRRRSHEKYLALSKAKKVK